MSNYVFSPFITALRIWANQQVSKHFIIKTPAEWWVMEHEAREEARAQGYADGLEMGKHEVLDILSGFDKKLPVLLEKYEKISQLVERYERISQQLPPLQTTPSMRLRRTGEVSQIYREALMEKGKGKSPSRPLQTIPYWYTEWNPPAPPAPWETSVSRPLPPVRIAAPSQHLDFTPVDIDWKLPTTEDPILLNDEPMEEDTMKRPIVWPDKYQEGA